MYEWILLETKTVGKVTEMRSLPTFLCKIRESVHKFGVQIFFRNIIHHEGLDISIHEIFIQRFIIGDIGDIFGVNDSFRIITETAVLKETFHGK